MKEKYTSRRRRRSFQRMMLFASPIMNKKVPETAAPIMVDLLV